MPRYGRLGIVVIWLAASLAVSASATTRQDEPAPTAKPSEPPAAVQPTQADPTPAPAPSPTPEPRPKAKSKPSAKSATDSPANVTRPNVVGLLKSANPMVWPLGLCSVVALGYTLERLVALRRRRVIPRDFVERFLDRLSGGKLDRDRALELCRAHDCPMGRVFAAVVANWGQAPAQIRQAATHETASELLDLRRNVRVLNATATLAPLLGLLGTVIGMIEAFDAIGGAGAAGMPKGDRLAHGISLALLTTAAGLGIAIVSVAGYYYLLNKVDVLVRDIDDNARKAIDLIAVDTPTAAPIARSVNDRRTTHHDLTRAETRTLGRSEPL